MEVQDKYCDIEVPLCLYSAIYYICLGCEITDSIYEMFKSTDAGLKLPSAFGARQFDVQFWNSLESFVLPQYARYVAVDFNWYFENTYHLQRNTEHFV